jgi:hypothetical protein
MDLAMKPQEVCWLPGFSGCEKEMLLLWDKTEGERKDGYAV